MNNPALPYGLGCELRFRGFEGRGSDAKKFLALFPCNPLISLISDERIQGNPRKSNGQKAGIFVPRLPSAKKIQIDRISVQFAADASSRLIDILER